MMEGSEINNNIFLLLIIFIGVFVVAKQLFFIYKIFQSNNWIEAEGEIICSSLYVIESFGEVGKSFRSKIKYVFFVDGVKYESNRVFYGDRLGSSFKSRATSILKKYSVGHKIKVFYNPMNTNESILERRISIEVLQIGRASCRERV